MALDAWTSSDEAGSCKPDAAIFHLALAKAGVDPHDALFVGDSTIMTSWGRPRSACRRPGWRRRPGSDPGDARPDAIIHALGDVLDLVGLGAVP